MNMDRDYTSLGLELWLRLELELGLGFGMGNRIITLCSYINIGVHTCYSPRVGIRVVVRV